MLKYLMHLDLVIMNNELIINLYRHLMGLNEFTCDNTGILLEFDMKIKSTAYTNKYYTRNIQVFLTSYGIDAHVLYGDGEKNCTIKYNLIKYNLAKSRFVDGDNIYGGKQMENAIRNKLLTYHKLNTAFTFGYYE